MDRGRAYQILSPPKMVGTTNIIASGANREPHNDMIAEISPLPMPVKKDDTNRLKPNKIQPRDRMCSARTVIAQVSAL